MPINGSARQQKTSAIFELTAVVGLVDSYLPFMFAAVVCVER